MMLSFSRQAASVILPAEMNALRNERAPSLAPSVDTLWGKVDSETNSLTEMSLVWSLSSLMPMPLITIFPPRRLILMRYCREDWLWA